MKKEIVILVVDLLSKRDEVLEYMSEGEVWGNGGEIGFDDNEIWCEEFMSGKYKWLDEECSEYGGIKIEFEKNDIEDLEVLCFKLWIGKLYIEGMF